MTVFCWVVGTTRRLYVVVDERRVVHCARVTVVILGPPAVHVQYESD